MKTYIYIITLFFSNLLIAQDDFFGSSSSIGGYGELHYNNTSLNNNTKEVLDFHRFVLFYGHQWNDKWSFKAEVELEHNFVAEGEGELELEQAYVDYHFANYLGFQAGVILPSVGLINEYHEPPLFFGVERPEYSKVIIPTTWFGNGIALYGNYLDFDYKLTVMEGLNADKFSQSSGIRSGRQKGYKANAENLLYNARVDYLGVAGLRIGGSISYNKAMGDSLDIPVTLIEGHIKYTANNLYIVSEYGIINYSEGNLEKSQGYYLDLGYNIAEIIGCRSKIIPFARYSNYNTASTTMNNGDEEKANDNTQWMIGINLLPISEVVFKVDYGEVKNTLTDQKTTLFNLGVGYMF